MNENNGYTLLKDAIDREMNNYEVACGVNKKLESGAPKKTPRVYKKSTSHIIFGINLDARFTCKKRFGIDVHKVDTPP